MSETGYSGTWTPTDRSGEFNAQAFLINQLINRVATITLARVVAVTNAGSVAVVGFVDVVPLINQVNGIGQGTPHGQINNLPYFRLQGGTDAIILDPKVGDIGIVGFCSRDISTVKATKKQANPGSNRKFDWADGLYIGGVLNGVPTQYVRFSSSGIDIVTPGTLTLNAGTIVTTGTLLNNGLHVGSTHVHKDVQSGISNTGTPAV